MSKTTILYTHEFASAHRLQGHPGKCAHLHGHNYIATIELEDTRDHIDDMVLDFGVVKSTIGKWLDETYDHAVILKSNDPLYKAIKGADPDTKFVILMHRPTAEIMAKAILNDLNICIHEKVCPAYRVNCVTLQESTGQSAKYTRED